MKQYIKSVFYENDKLYIIDQTKLPEKEEIIVLNTTDEVFDAIINLKVRGAPAIGITAAYGVCVALNEIKENNIEKIKIELLEKIKYLSESRPTAYNLFYALNRMKNIILSDNITDRVILKKEIENEAIKIHKEDLYKSEKISEYGLNILPDNPRIISHCNAGGLATGGGGTSLGIIFKAKEMGKKPFVYVDETRPLLQGSRLTAWELQKLNIDYKIIADNMAGFLMKQNKVDLILVGADRITMNGDFANKIGTYSLSVLAKHHGIPFYTAAPLSTFDFSLNSGDEIPIEERKAHELIYYRKELTAPENSKVYNPAFDITPHQNLTGIITEYGIIYPPFYENILKLKNKINNP